MFILEISCGYPTQKYPLIGIFEFDQAKSLVVLGHKVVLAAIDLRSIRRKRKWGLIIEQKSGVIIYNYNFPVGNVPTFIISILTSYFLKKVYKKIEKKIGKPNVLHAHFCFPMGYAAARLKQKHSIPLVITEHSSELIKDFNNRRKKYYQFGYDHADKIISVGHNLQDQIFKKFKKKSVTLFNIVDLSVFNYIEKKNSTPFIFISVANLIARKGIDILIKAFAQIKNSNALLFIIGDGPEKKNLYDLTIEQQVQNRVHFLGALTRDQIASRLYESHCFVLASRFETFGVVYIEALATGTPIIATNCGGPSDIVTAENGIMVEVDNIQQLTQAMNKIQVHFSDYNKKNISDSTKIQFAPEVIGKQLEKVLLEVKL